MGLVRLCSFFRKECFSVNSAAGYSEIKNSPGEANIHEKKKMVGITFTIEMIFASSCVLSAIYI